MTIDEQIQRQLHDAAGEIRTGTTVPSTVRRRIRVGRVRTVAMSMVFIAALVYGGTFAAANLGDGGRSFGPADGSGKGGPALGTFYADFADGRITLVADGETGILCAATEGVGGTAALSRLDIVGPDGLVPVYPSDDPVDDSNEDFECIHDVPEDFVRAMTGAPELYSLSIEGPDGSEDAPLELAGVSEVPDRDRCRDDIPFEPTYLAEGWSPELQPGSAAGLANIDIIVGHYGIPGESGFEKMGAGFLDLQANLGDFEPAPGATDIRILGRKGSLVGPNDNGAYSVRFGYDGCVYTLGGNATREIIESFAEGLRLN